MTTHASPCRHHHLAATTTPDPPRAGGVSTARSGSGPRASKASALARGLATLTAFLMLAPAASATSPWVLLEELRESMQTAGPITGKFVQTYVPSGFSTGDRESGFLSLWLPTCLRWNYEEPEEKHFLLCGEEVWFWNDLEPMGRHYRIDPEQEPGLDLLLVEVDRLQERYSAQSTRLADGTFEISLATPSDALQAFGAKIRVDPVADRVVGLEFTDSEGNLTRFEITGYQKLEHTGLFRAPVDMEWTEE
ncbi:MAG: outer membrane lipoprotein carrier protein LolA [Holophagales bacterium]|nr:outer membrane lipoprotein carrier protein LolA [Holophagales bacterium]